MIPAHTSGAGVVSSTSAALGNLEDRTHSHTVPGTGFSTVLSIVDVLTIREVSLMPFSRVPPEILPSPRRTPSPEPHPPHQATSHMHSSSPALQRHQPLRHRRWARCCSSPEAAHRYVNPTKGISYFAHHIPMLIEGVVALNCILWALSCVASIRGVSRGCFWRDRSHIWWEDFQFQF